MSRPFYSLPPPWNPGYAIPGYVLDEPLRFGTYTTKWLPRGTMNPLLPDELAVPVGADEGVPSWLVPALGLGLVAYLALRKK